MKLTEAIQEINYKRHFAQAAVRYYYQRAGETWKKLKASEDPFESELKKENEVLIDAARNLNL
ncbi:MAG: hypothetical protein WAN36_11140, partial [Calditrichia bacterium]